jgi:hypothetical protein
MKNREQDCRGADMIGLGSVLTGFCDMNVATAEADYLYFPKLKQYFFLLRLGVTSSAS